LNIFVVSQKDCQNCRVKEEKHQYGWKEQKSQQMFLIAR